MTHDPLCEASSGNPYAVLANQISTDLVGWCSTCALIAKVRADERSRIADAVFDNMASHPYEYPSDYAEADRKWIKAGCPTDAIDALRGES